MNYKTQYYKGIPLNLISRKYKNMKAKRFVINHTNQNVWIPNKHLKEDGTIKEKENIDYVFRKSIRKLELAGITPTTIKSRISWQKQGGRKWATVTEPVSIWIQESTNANWQEKNSHTWNGFVESSI